MKRNLLSLIIVFFLILNANAQQALQKITTQTNQTIVELYPIRNGTSNSNVIGSGGYDQDLSQTFGSDIIYIESTGLIYNNISAQIQTPPTYPTEQIANGTFEIGITPYPNNRRQKIFNWKSSGISLTTSDLTVDTFSTDRDAIEDGNTNVDMLHSKWVLPHTYDNGSALPIGMWIILTSRDGVPDTGPTQPSKRIGFRWNGSQWVQQVNDPAGTPFDNLQNATLGVNDFENNNAEIQIYPNPTRDMVNASSEKELIESVEVLDMQGRNLRNIKTNSKKLQIDIHDLERAVYLLKVKTDKGIQTFKVIKN